MSAATPPPDPPEPLRPAVSGPTGSVLAALTVMVVVVLVAPLLAAVVHAGRGGDDRAGTAVMPSPSTSGSTASPVPTPPPSPSTTAGPRSVTCWDGAQARRTAGCNEPSGADGLTWVFPSIPDQRCGKATDSGPSGTVLRRVCRARVGGGRALVVYAQWRSPADAVAFFRAQGLTPDGGSGAAPIRRFVSPDGKLAAVYAEEPYSYTVTLPAGADPAASAGQVVRARPADQVRGAPTR